MCDSIVPKYRSQTTPILPDRLSEAWGGGGGGGAYILMGDH
jgi:hypothetical protein